MNIDKLKEANQKLAALLNDPHEGLVTWNHFVYLRVEEIVAETGWTKRLDDEQDSK